MKFPGKPAVEQKRRETPLFPKRNNNKTMAEQNREKGVTMRYVSGGRDGKAYVQTLKFETREEMHKYEAEVVEIKRQATRINNLKESGEINETEFRRMKLEWLKTCLAFHRSNGTQGCPFDVRDACREVIAYLEGRVAEE